MSTKITTNADLIAAYPTTEAELDRLATQTMRDTQWVQLHTAAWTRILADLAKRRPQIVEADLVDTSQIKPASIYYVMHLIYLNAELDADQKRAKYWLGEYIREMQEIVLDLGSSTYGSVAPNAYSVRTFRG